MRAILSLGLGLSLLTPLAAAQQTALAEDFDAGLVPPTGWFEENNGVTLGWEANGNGSKAEHEDYFAGAFNDNRLLSPALDLSSFSEAYLHLKHDQQFPGFRELNAIEVSLDGGASFIVLLEIDGSETFNGLPLEVDLSAYAGLTGVQISFHYQGDYANLWRIDDVVVDDVPPPPPTPLWPKLPTEFRSTLGFHENFEEAAGVIPSYLAVNALDPVTRENHPDAWCNLGQLGACSDPYDGSFALEMGKRPGAAGAGDVANALVFGLNGATSDDFLLSFEAVQYGEEYDEEDGVFLSLDGVNWTSVATDWSQIIPGVPGQRSRVEVPLAQSGLDLSGDFYLALAQRDNFPYATMDGVGIDNLTLDAPQLAVPGLVGGQVGTFHVDQAQASSLVVIAYSTRPGPTATPFGNASLGSNYEEIGRYTPDAQGTVSAQFFIPSVASGMTIWLQAAEILAGGDGLFSNGLVVEIQ